MASKVILFGTLAVVVVALLVAVLFVGSRFRSGQQLTTNTTKTTTNQSAKTTSTVMQGPRTTCLAISGYFCIDPVYNHTSGNLTLKTGQATGSNWASAEILFVGDNATYSNGIPASWANATVISGGLLTGQAVNATLRVSKPVKVGAFEGGTLWLKYQLTNGGTEYYSELSAGIFVRAV